MGDFLRWRIGEVTVTRVVELTSAMIGNHILPQAFLDRYADRPVLIIGTHFAGPTAGRVVRDGNAFRLDC